MSNNTAETAKQKGLPAYNLQERFGDALSANRLGGNEALTLRGTSYLAGYLSVIDRTPNLLEHITDRGQQSLYAKGRADAVRVPDVAEGWQKTSQMFLEMEAEERASKPASEPPLDVAL